MFIEYARIDPGNAFRLVVKVAKFVADGEYGLVEMADQQHNIWLDRTMDYTLSKFHDDMATKIIWGHHKLFQSGQLTMTVILSGKSEGMNTLSS